MTVFQIRVVIKVVKSSRFKYIHMWQTVCNIKFTILILLSMQFSV